MWINTSKTPFNLEQHPFSIAGGEIGTGTLSFVIRELGDYTSSLDSLQPGQTVYVDGPYGSMSVDQGRSSAGITLIAGGAGIAPLLGLLRELAKRNETRPVRLVYGNRNLDRMVAISELRALTSTMRNFSVQLVCNELPGGASQGSISARGDRRIDHPRGNRAGQAIRLVSLSMWSWGMISANVRQLKAIGVKSDHIHFEQLAF